MNITEAALILNVSESYIYEYIRNGLLPNHHLRDKNPEFDDNDILLLKEIIILRKLGWGSLDIYDNYKKKKNLLKITKSLLKYADAESEKARLYQMIVDDNSDRLDIERYWELTCDCKELNKEYFEPFSSFESFKEFTQDQVFKRLRFKKENGIGIWRYILILLGISFVVELIRKFVFHSDNNILFGAVYPLLLVILLIVISFFIFIFYRLLGARISTYIFNIFIGIVILFFVAIILLIIVALFNTVRDWLINIF